MPSESGSTSPAPPNSTSGTDRNGERRLSTSSYDPTPYVQRARVTRPAPPKPSVNPMQFVQIKPCNLYQNAQEQAKRAEEVKKVKEIKKEEPEDWQSNLDNWKSSRRKRVEHIIDRVVEVKKLELEEHDRTRRKTKTFSEMLGERGTRRKLSAIPVYNEDESNDLSDLGIGTSSASASGKSSLSEDYDNHSVMSDNTKTEKPTLNGNNTNHENGGNSRDYTSSPCYDTSSSTAPASSPDPCEYTYEGAIEDYKSRISRAQTNNYNGFRRNTISASYSKDSTPERDIADTYYNRRMSNSKVEDRLSSFEIKTASDQVLESSVPKKDLPKVDILKRRELFEKDNNNSSSSTTTTDYSNQKRFSCDFTNNKSIKERFSSTSEKKNEDIINNKNINRLSGDITSIKDRLQTLKQKQTSINDKAPKIVDVPVVSLKDRLTSLHSAAKKEEIKKPVVLIDEHQLEILKKEELEKRNALKRECFEDESISSSQELLNLHYESNVDTDREDSGIHTTDVSCSVSQTDEQPEIVNEETHHLQHINEDNLHLNVTSKHNNERIDETIVKQIPDVIQHSHTNKFDNIISNTDIISERKELIVQQTEDLASDQDTSVNEALEMALQAIDIESTTESELKAENNIDNKSPNRLFKRQEKNDLTNQKPQSREPIYENLDDITLETVYKTNSIPYEKPIETKINDLITEIDEPYYQVPKSSEPYYEVPKSNKQVPVYENIDIFYTEQSNCELSISSLIMEPPKEKPPPPPIDDPTDDEDGESGGLYEPILQKSTGNECHQPIKRMNSTKRIKKELRSKRSSFLGIEGSNDDDSFLELTVAPPPDMAQLLQEEKRLEKQLYMKAGLYDSSDTVNSRDSGVSENHSRQSSEPFTTSSEEQEDLLSRKGKEIIKVLEQEEEKRKSTNWIKPEETDVKMQCLEDQIREQEEVLRVERELLQLEQEELKRQRENLLVRENMARRELEHGAKMLMSANRHSLQNLNITTNHYANLPNQIYQVETNYRKSMSDLPDFNPKRIPPAPPAKPLRSHASVDVRQNVGLVKIASPANIQHSQSVDEFVVPVRNYQPASALHHGNMSRHTLHALSATPKPKFTDGWVQAKKSPEKTNESRLSVQQKRKSVPEGYNYNKHWLIQEAEQRRIDQQRSMKNNAINGWGSSSAIHRNGNRDNKPLPDAVIQTLTQRVQSKGIGERKRLDLTPTNEAIIAPSAMSSLSIGCSIPEGQTDKVLSVSGKKKCSHCGEELAGQILYWVHGIPNSEFIGVNKVLHWRTQEFL